MKKVSVRIALADLPRQTLDTSVEALDSFKHGLT
jgi:hypothetical protein